MGEKREDKGLPWPLQIGNNIHGGHAAQRAPMSNFNSLAMTPSYEP